MIRRAKYSTPTSNRVLLERASAEQVTKGGVIIPDAHQRQNLLGTIQAVGPGRRLDDGTRTPMNHLRPGDQCIFAKYPGGDNTIRVTTRVDDDDLIMVREPDILATRTGNGAWLPARNRAFIRRLRNPDRTGAASKAGLILPDYRSPRILDLPVRAREYADLPDEYWLGEVLAVAECYHEPEKCNWLGPMHQTRCHRVTPEFKPGDRVVLGRYAGSHVALLEHLVNTAEGEQLCCAHWRDIEAVLEGEGSVEYSTTPKVATRTGKAESVEEPEWEDEGK